MHRSSRTYSPDRLVISPATGRFIAPRRKRRPSRPALGLPRLDARHRRANETGHPAPEGLYATKIPALFDVRVLNGKPRNASFAVPWPFGRPHEQSKEAEIRGTTVRECFAVHRPSGASTTSETPSHGFRVPLRRDAPRLATTLDPLRVIPKEPACLARGTSRMSGRSFGCVAGCGSTNSRLIPLWPTRR